VHVSTDRRVKLPEETIMKKLQHRPRLGRQQTTGLGTEEGSAFSKDKRAYKLPMVRDGFTLVIAY